MLLILLALTSPVAHAAIGTENDTTIVRQKMTQALRRGQPLKEVYQELHKTYGSRAVASFVAIVSDDRSTDEIKWASVFGIARLAGNASVGLLKKFMSNSNWLIRDAALKAAAALNLRELTPQVEQRLKDSALIVRTTAVQTIGHLELKKSAPKLVDALFDPINYHGNTTKKGLWIHKYILQTLRDFQYKESVPKLVELLKTTSDNQLQAQVVQTLEHLTGKSFPGKTMHEQIYLWKRNTVSELTF